MQKNTPLPITQHVIDQVHTLAWQDKLLRGLKIESNIGVVLYNLSWSIMVEYANTEHNNVNNYKCENHNENAKN